MSSPPRDRAAEIDAASVPAIDGVLELLALPGGAGCTNGTDTFVLQGGLDAWAAAGLPLRVAAIEGDDTPRYCVASESCAFDIIGAQFLRDVQPGEIVTLSEKGLQTRMGVQGDRNAFCVFEYIYFDSELQKAFKLPPGVTTATRVMRYSRGASSTTRSQLSASAMRRSVSIRGGRPAGWLVPGAYHS